MYSNVFTVYTCKLRAYGPDLFGGASWEHLVPVAQGIWAASHSVSMIQLL